MEYSLTGYHSLLKIVNGVLQHVNGAKMYWKV